MSEDSGQEAFAAALSGADAPVVTETVVTPETPAAGQDGATQVEPAAGGQPGAEQTDRGDHVPSWRLREVAEERRREAEARQMLERQLAEYKRQEAERQRQAEEEAQKAAGFDWENPDKFVDGRLQSGIQKALTPVEQQLQQFKIGMSRRWAMKEHGEEAVNTAWQAALAAVQAGDPTAKALNDSISSSEDPFGDLMTWHRQKTVLQETGGDLASYQKKLREQALEDALKDPAFLQRALEATRQQAKPVTTGDPRKSPAAIPSLNRTTAGADISDEESDPRAVFQSEMASRGR